MSSANPFFINGERAPSELCDLLEKLPARFESVELTSDDLQILDAADAHAENYNHALIDGIDAIGRLLFIASTNTGDGVSSDLISKTGHLLSAMAVQAQYLGELQSSIRFTLSKQGDKA